MTLKVNQTLAFTTASFTPYLSSGNYVFEYKNLRKLLEALLFHLNSITFS